MSPAFGEYNPAISRASVLFPEPLSPTNPKLSPVFISIDTSSTAFNEIRFFRNKACRIENSIDKFLTETAVLWVSEDLFFESQWSLTFSRVTFSSDPSI